MQIHIGKNIPYTIKVHLFIHKQTEYKHKYRYYTTDKIACLAPLCIISYGDPSRFRSLPGKYMYIYLTFSLTLEFHNINCWT